MHEEVSRVRSGLEGLDLNDLVVFARVVQHGSFTTSAQAFGKSPSYMSKHIAQLESYFTTALLHRSTHRVFPTDAGQVLFEHCLRILGEIDAAKSASAQLNEEMVGLLRVHSTTGIGQKIVTPATAIFTDRFPEMRVELSFSIYSSSLMERQVDVLIASRDFDYDRFSQSGLFERKLGAVPYVICASPAYLERNGSIEHPEGLKAHNCLIHKKKRGRSDVWRCCVDGRDHLVEVTGRFSSNLENAVYEAALQGNGVARLPLYAVSRDLKMGTLVTLFDGGTSTTRWIKAFYPRSAYVPRKVYEFLKIIESGIAASSKS